MTFPWSDTTGDVEVVETADAVVVGVPGTVSGGDCVALAEIRRVR